ncbi:MAG: FUSC family protein [Myxococcaceae bacterium]|nr:FUSC family protein [Myxococcaceae bacterium]MCI0673738.1 FUSC family protein [Myxococcaceae bacterium]
MKSLPLLLTLLATLALAATPLESARVGAGEARGRVESLRREQLSLRGDLGTLSGRIESLKGERAASEELDAALKKSQALSTTLTGLAQSLVEAERRSEVAQLALLDALSAERTRLRGLFEATTDRDRKASLLTRLRSVRAEQERVRLLLPATLLPAVPAGVATEDDPEDLLEQADALRDGEDRVRQRLAEVKRQLHDAREERALTRRMDDFLGDEAMFDEQDRRLRPPAARAVTEGASPDQGTDVGVGIFGGETEEAPPPGLPPRAVDARRAHVGERVRGGPVSRQEEDVESLEALLKQLESQARSLGQRAMELEKRARELQ